jgi:hypothetical protein
MAWNKANPTKSHKISEIPGVTQDNFDALEHTIGLEHSNTLDGALSGRHTEMMTWPADPTTAYVPTGYLPGVMYEGPWSDISALTETSAGAIVHDTTYGALRIFNGTNWSGVPSGLSCRAWAMSGYTQQGGSINNMVTADIYSSATNPLITPVPIWYDRAWGQDAGFSTTSSDINTGNTYGGMYTPRVSGAYLVIACMTLVASGYSPASAEMSAAGKASPTYGWIGFSDDSVTTGANNQKYITGGGGTDFVQWSGVVQHDSGKYHDAYTYLAYPKLKHLPNEATDIEVRFHLRARQTGCGCNNRSYEKRCTSYGTNCDCDRECYGNTDCTCDGQCYGYYPDDDCGAERNASDDT